MSNGSDELKLWNVCSGFAKSFLVESVPFAGEETFSKRPGHFSAALGGEKDFTAPTIISYQRGS